MKKLYSLPCALIIMMQLSLSAQNVSVTASAGTVVAVYPTLKAAFDNINNGTHQGIIDIRVLSSTTETATCLLDSSGNLTSSSYSSILIRPGDFNTLATTISMSVTDAPLIALRGADNVTIDGRPLGDGTTSMLTFSNTVDGGTTHTLELRNGASNNNINYCTFENSVNGGGLSNNVRILTGSNSGNTISNSTILGGFWGLEINGNNATPNTNNSVLSSHFVNQSATGIRLLAGAGNTIIEANRIYHTVASINNGYQALQVNFVDPASTVRFTNNRVYNLSMSTIGNSIIAVAFNSNTAASGTLLVTNNSVIVGSASNPNSLSVIIRGFLFNGTFPATVVLEHNTFRIGGTQNNNAGSTPNSAGIHKLNSGATSSFTSRNNLSINTRTGGTFPHVGNLISNPTSGTNILDYNTYYGTPQVAIWVSTQFNNLAAYKAVTGANEQNSSFGNLEFVDEINPDLLALSVINTPALLTGIPSAITTDIYGTTRSLTEPYRGAFEGAPLTVVPVHLVSFGADVKKEDVYLTWNSSSEINNRGYDIERSVDGRVFNKVGFIAGNPVGTVSNTYNYIDVAAFSRASSQILYYRLKQLDINGRFAFSPVKVVTKGNSNLNTISAYPNPFLKTLQLTIESRTAGYATIQLIDASGKVMYNTIRPVTSGVNNITIKETGNLGNGIYYMKVVTGDANKIIKLIKAL